MKLEQPPNPSPKQDYELVTHSPEETQRLGTRIGELAAPGDIYLLIGALGTGKTCLTQGIAWGLNIKEYAVSPSFMLVRELYYGAIARKLNWKDASPRM